MAASSPIATNNGLAAASPSASLNRTDTPPKNLRGLNKPKCIQCGNVARSRCPYQSCKGCCSKAENPCPIHVLKAAASFSDKTPSSAPPVDQKQVEVSPAGGSHRVSSLRQLSNNFSQFNNLTVSLRSKKPLTKKDAIALNEWRFSKLKEYKARNIEVVNEAFDRYMRNVSLLEEVFSKTTFEGATEDKSTEPNNAGQIISGLKLKLRSNGIRTDTFRKRIRQIVDQGLKKLHESELNDDPSGQDDLDNNPKRPKSCRGERVLALADLIDKLNRARNEEDLKSCLEMKSQLYTQPTASNKTDTQDIQGFIDQSSKGQSAENKELDRPIQKLFTDTQINEETLDRVNAHFSSLKNIGEL